MSGTIAESVDFEKRKMLFEEIKKLSRLEMEELYKIIKKQKEDISENRNGMFFDLLCVKEDTFDKIKDWITFCLRNRESFEQREQEIRELQHENPGIFQQGIFNEKNTS
jgi:hypothetical protein